MNNRMTLQKVTAFFLVVIILLGIIVPNTIAFAEGVIAKDTITDVKKTDKETKEKINPEEQADKRDNKTDSKKTDKEAEEKINPEEQKDKQDNKSEIKDDESEVKEEATKPKLNQSLMESVSLNSGAPMDNGKLMVYDDNHKIKDTSNGDGTSVNPYNLATMTNTLFTINYTPFYQVKDDGSTEFGDQRIVVDIPTYGFKLVNPGIEGVQFEKITMLDAKGKVIPLDAVSQKNYDKVVKIIYDINDNFLRSLGGGSSLVFNIAFNRRSLTDEECKKWIDEGKLETKLNVTACEGENNTPINSTGNSSEYKWRMSPTNYDDPKTTVTGDRHLNASSMAKIANSGFVKFYDTDPASGPFTGNRDYYYYNQGTVHDGNTPLMSLKHIKVYVPKNGSVEGNFILQKLQIRNGLYDLDLAYYATVSEMKNDGDGKGNYYLITPRKALYNNGSDHKWNDAFTKGFSPIWQVPDGIENIGSDTLYEATTPEFVFETPNGTDGKKEVVISADGQGVKIKTMKANTVDGYEIHTFSGPGYQLYKNAGGFYTANAVSPDANYTDVGYTRLSNEYYILKDANGDWNEYFPKNKTGATVETYEFPEEIQPTAWKGTAQTWSTDSYKVAKVVYTTADGNEHTVDVNSFVHLANKVNNFPDVKFDTSGGRVTKVEVHWEHLNNDTFNASTHYAGKYNANTHRLSYAQSKFDYYVTPTATGHLQVKYSTKSTDPNADATDHFDYEANKVVKNPVNNVSGKARDDFFWTTVTQKKCTPLKAESTGDRLKENVLYPNQAENGTFYDTWKLFFDYGTKKEFSPVTKNPRIDLTVGTLNLKGLDSKADKTGLLTGKFTANKSLSGWKIIYKTADNVLGVESVEKVYNIGDIEDGTKIDLGINRDLEHLSSIVLTYDGVYNIEPFADKETGEAVLFSNIEYELRNTDFKGNPLTIEKEKGAWYGPNYFVQNLEGKYYNESCRDSNHIHDAGKGQDFGGRTWNSIKLPQRYGILTRTYIVTNKTADNVIEPSGNDTNNSISQSGTSTQKVKFNTKAYAYAMNSDMPEAGKLPYGIPESAYVEITDKQFAADVDKCKFLGFDNASGNVIIKQVTDADGRVWIKMSITEAGIQALNRQMREITKNKAFSYYYYYNDSVLKFMEDPVVIALKSFRYTSVTSPGENEHYPYGMVYYDMSPLETKLDGSKNEYYSHAKIEGDLFQLSENAANALDATKEKKLFGIDLSKVQVVVAKNTAVGSNLFPGKYDNIVYGTAGSKFPTQTFYPDEAGNLRGDFFVQAPDADGFKDYKAIIEIPKKDKSVSYTQKNETVQTPKTQVDMYLTGEVKVMGDSRPGKQEFSYSIDGGNTFVSAENITDWGKVTHVKLDLGELPKGSQVNIKLPLKTHAKTTTDELEAYIGGSFETTDYTGVKTSGYINPAKYIYGNYVVMSSDVWWDKNENGKLDEGETKAKGVKLELYSPDHDVTINNKLIPANTLIHSSTTDENGGYELKSFMSEAGQWIKVTMPNGETKLTLKAKDSDMLKSKNSDFDRTSYKTAELPELVKEKPLEIIGCGLIRVPKIKTEPVKIHVGEESEEGAAKAVATSDHPTVSPELKYIELQNDVADVDGSGKIRGKSTGKIKAEVTTTNTLASSDQAIPEDTVKAEYDIIVYGKVNYHKNHADVNGEAPKDNNEYYPSITENGNDADTDKVTVLDAGTMKRSGYIFKGWNTQADGKGTMYSKGDTFKTGTIDKDVELYAIWSLIWTPMEIPTRAVTVTKEWKNFLGTDIAAPVDSVTVELYKDGVATGQVQELKSDNNWTATFEQLPVSATLGGENHEYSIKEVGESSNTIQLAGKWYGVGYAGSMKDGFTITNKEKTPWAPMIPPTRDVKVTKEWKDSAGNAVSAPVDSVTVELYKDGVATGQVQELKSDNNWTATFEQLPVSATLGGENHEYTIKEVGETLNNISLAGKWYGVGYAGSMKDGFTITNKEKTPWAPMIPPTRDVKVTKEWKDSAGNAVSAPVDSVTVELYKDGVATGQVQELKSDNNWTATFEQLPVSATLGGENHEYTIKEVGETLNNISLAGKWYGVGYAGSMKDGFTITNKEKTPWAPMIPPTRDVKVTKEWKDSAGNAVSAPVDSVTVELYKDGVATGQVQELKSDNNWTATFEQLPVSATLGGENHEYSIKEVGESSNTIQLAGKWYGVGYAGSMKDGFTITNKEKTPWAPMIPPTRDVKVTKEWKDSAGNAVSAPVDSVTVELYKDGVATGQVQELKSDNNWTATFEQLPVSATLGGENHEYSIKEVGESSNTIQLAGKWYGVGYAGSMKDGFTITNKEKTPWAPMIPPTRDVKVTKEWKDSAGNAVSAPVDSVTVELYKDGVATGQVQELKSDNNWTATFEQLPVSATLGGENHEYSIKEVGESSNTIQLAGKWYGVGYAGSMKDGFTITNKEKTPWAPMIPPTRDVKVTKEWKDSAGNAVSAPVDSVTVELYKDGVATGQVQELKSDNNWTATFEQLPVSATLGGENHEYSIKEVGESSNTIQLAGKWYGVGYAGSMKDGFTITNKEKTPWAPMIPPTRDVKVTKEWKDSAGNAVSAPVDSVTVELYKDGVATGQVQELKSDNNWTATFEQLPVSATLGGENHEYTIKEVGETLNNISLAGKWYGVGYAGSMKDGFTITNKEKTPWAPMIPPTRDVKVTKEWKDSAGNAVSAPVDSVTVELYKDGVATGQVQELKSDNNWTATFEQLPVSATLGGENHEYTIKEVGETLNNISLAGKWYGVGYAGSMKDGFTITNKEKTPWAPMIPPTRDVKVTKEWKDSAGNAVSAPVDSVTVELYKDGVATGQVQELKSDNNWTATFEQLPVSATLGGENHEYTIKEVGETLNNISLAGKWYGVGYAGSMKDGFTITNKEKTPWAPMIPPTRDVKVTKEWKDSAGNAVSAPVDSVTVELYKDGVATGQVQELKSDNNWTATFEQLPVSATLGGENHEYTIKEVGETLNNISLAGKWYGVGYAGSMKDGFTITNKEKTPWAPMIPPTRDVKVTKEWKDSAGNAVSAPVDSVTVELYKDGVATGQVQELKSDNNWTATFEQLPVSATLGGENHEYTIKEVGETLNNISLAGKWYGVGYAGSMKDGFTITNKEKTPWAPMIPPTRDVKVTKEWKDSAGNAVSAPVDSVTVELYKDGVATGQVQELKSDNNWTATFEQLPVSATLGGENHEYTIKEVGETLNNISLAGKWYGVGYAGSMKDGFTITNKEKTPWAPMIPPTRDVKVTKEWKDSAGNAVSAPVDSVTVELYKDGVATGQVQELKSDNNWTATFEQLPVSATLGGENHEYSIKEVGESSNTIQLAGKWYGVSYEGSMQDGFTLTNQEKTPTKPSTPTPNDPGSNKSGAPNKSNNKPLPKTGDGSSISQYAWIMLISGVLLMFIEYRRKIKYSRNKK